MRYHYKPQTIRCEVQGYLLWGYSNCSSPPGRRCKIRIRAKPTIRTTRISGVFITKNSVVSIFTTADRALHIYGLLQRRNQSSTLANLPTGPVRPFEPTLISTRVQAAHLLKRVALHQLHAKIERISIIFGFELKWGCGR